MFFDTYREAREDFLRIAESRGAAVRSEVLPGETGLHGETLAMDVCTLGPAEAAKALVVVCGTHGLEGAAGSAIQRDQLSTIDTLPDDVKLVAVHALNPWGFSHGSRTDHRNIDPNRNFLAASELPPYSDAYAELHPFQCPPVWDDEVSARLWGEVRRLAEANGLDYVLGGMTSGQYQQADGLNYGGTEPSWSQTAFATVAATELAGCDQVAYVEWHTGFGEYGELFHIVTHPAGSAALDRVARWWGRETVTRNGDAIEGAEGATPRWRGLLLNALPGLLPGAEVAGAVVECGTYSNETVLKGLMIDRWLKFGGALRGSRTRAELEQQKRDVFIPQDPAWRKKVLDSAAEVHARALAGLAQW